MSFEVSVGRNAPKCSSARLRFARLAAVLWQLSYGVLGVQQYGRR